MYHPPQGVEDGDKFRVNPLDPFVIEFVSSDGSESRGFAEVVTLTPDQASLLKPRIEKAIGKRR